MAITHTASIPQQPRKRKARKIKGTTTASAVTTALPLNEAPAVQRSASWPATPASYAARVGYTPSQYQADIFSWIERGTGNAVVNAVAGSGKTTSAVSAARFIPRSTSALFLAFNNHIVEALALKLAGTPMTARTIHSAGFGMIAEHLAGSGRMQKPDARKYMVIAKALTLGAGRMADDLRFDLQRALAALGSKVRVTLTDPQDASALDALCEEYGITLRSERLRAPLYELLPHLLLEGERQARELHFVDFDDMISLPARWNLRPSTQVGWLFVDELQDLSCAQLNTAMRLLAPGGCFIGVGDPRQAIMGFAGAAVDSFDQAARQTDAVLLPLSICYRCPASHLALAREIVPQIEARPHAPEGTVEHISRDKLGDFVRPGDMVICRLTAPLIEECMRLIEQGIPARVRGRDIGKQLSDIVRAVENMPNYTWAEFGEWLGAYVDSQVARLLQRDDGESAAESMQDRCAAIRACYQRFNSPDAQTFRNEMEALFDDGRPTVLLSTIHRAKGLEADRVFILRPDKLPLVWPKQQPWQLEQEWNLKYVALTRATEALFWVY